MNAAPSRRLIRDGEHRAPFRLARLPLGVVEGAMTQKSRILEVVARVERGEALSTEDLNVLKSAVPKARGRPSRDDLKLVQDEFGRAAAFARARAAGKGYDDAVNEAMDRTASSERSIKSALAWLRTVGLTWQELAAFIREDRLLAYRLQEGGIESLSAGEILRHGCNSRTYQIFESKFSVEERATFFLNGTFLRVSNEVFDRTVAALRALDVPSAGQVSSLPHSLTELAEAVDALATTFTNEIANRLKGCK